MKRIRLTIAYDGTDYAGFQVQPGQPTIEGELNRALSELTGENAAVIGASRTDSGVHALGNVAVFDTESPIPADRFGAALLPHLPDDIRIVCSGEVPIDWHPRHQHALKTYQYAISCGEVENPLGRRYAAYIRRQLDADAMREAASFLVGEHDFSSFANPSSQVLQAGGSAVRKIYGISISESGSRGSGESNDVKEAGLGNNLFYPDLGTRQILIRITGNGFLYNMVRIIAGTLIQVGTELWTPDRVREALEAKDRRAAGPTAEARGLTLCGIEYKT